MGDSDDLPGSIRLRDRAEGNLLGMVLVRIELMQELRRRGGETGRMLKLPNNRPIPVATLKQGLSVEWKLLLLTKDLLPVSLKSQFSFS